MCRPGPAPPPSRPAISLYQGMETAAGLLKGSHGLPLLGCSFPWLLLAKWFQWAIGNAHPRDILLSGLGTGTEIAPSALACLLQSGEAPCLSQPFSMDFHRFGIGQMHQKLAGSCVFLFPGTNELGFVGIIFCVNCLEGGCPVYFSDLSFASSTFRLLC